jgi:hypothetical protein
MVYGGLGLYRPWRGLRAWDWARMAVGRVREGHKSCLAWEGSAAGCFLNI